MKKIGHYVNGNHIEPESGRTHAVFNPATGEQTAAVGLASTDEVDAAVAAARDAFSGWRRTSLAVRAAASAELR